MFWGLFWRPPILGNYHFRLWKGLLVDAFFSCDIRSANIRLGSSRHNIQILWLFCSCSRNFAHGELRAFPENQGSPYTSHEIIALISGTLPLPWFWKLSCRSKACNSAGLMGPKLVKPPQGQTDDWEPLESRSFKFSERDSLCYSHTLPCVYMYTVYTYVCTYASLALPLFPQGPKDM